MSLFKFPLQKQQDNLFDALPAVYPNDRTACLQPRLSAWINRSARTVGVGEVRCAVGLHAIRSSVASLVSNASSASGIGLRIMRTRCAAAPIPFRITGTGVNRGETPGQSRAGRNPANERQ